VAEYPKHLAFFSIWRHDTGAETGDVRGRVAYRAGLPGGTCRNRPPLVLGGQVLMIALMIARHAPVYHWLDRRFW
jgi:hypothetical protein